ncbi:MAG: YdcF family protein [Candidatus Binatia bacterium]|nr:YdcF family protein [Candidatus Binatia bacterium]
MRRRRTIGCATALAGVAVLAALLFWQRQPILVAIGGFLVVQDVPTKSDAIVVLSGSVPDRILEAVDLYHAGLAPRLLLTREGRLPGLDELRRRGVALPERHEQNRDIALALGVPVENIEVIERRATSTLAEARELVALLQKQGMQRVLLVTSRAHARRARVIFRTLAAGHPEILVVPSRYDPFDPHTWWRERAFLRRVVTEYGKLLTWWLFDQWRIAR